MPVSRPGAARLRVLALNGLFPNPVRPAWGSFNADMLEHLAARADVRVIAPLRWSPAAGWTGAPEGALRRVPRRVRHGSLEVSHPRYPRVPLLVRRWHGALQAAVLWPHVARIARAHRPDVLLASWAYPDGFAAERLGARLGVPVVIRCLGSDLHQYLADPPRRGPLLRALARCAAIVTVSAALARLLARHGVPASRVDVVYNGVDRERFRPGDVAAARRALGLPAAGAIVLCVAHLVPVKGHHTLLQAAARLMARRADLTLVLVGDGPLRAALAQETQALGRADRVRFAGERPHAEIPRWMAASDAVALASLDEGLPNILVEALACGRPVVTTAVGGVPELVSSAAYGRLVPPDDPAALAEALDAVLARAWDPAALAACPALCSWAESTDRLLAVLRRVVAPAPG
jgi:glycosyltransferase involved in cell wall biosynthesis